MASENQRPGVDFEVSADDIEAADINGILANQNSIHHHDLRRVFEQNLKDRSNKFWPIFRLFRDLASFFLDSTSPVTPFGPIISCIDMRSMIPDDLTDKQIKILAKIASKINNSGLRARVSDVVWFRNRNNAEMGHLAVSSYCASIEALESGEAVLASGVTSPLHHSAIAYIQRSCYIAKAIGWDQSEFDQLKITIERLIQFSYDNQNFNGFCQISSVAMDWKVGCMRDIAAKAESLACSAPIGDEFHLKKTLWDLAARAHKLSKALDDEKRCRLQAAEILVQKSEQKDNSVLLRATFLQDAIARFRSIGGTKERRDALTVTLRELQLKILDEMKEIQHDVDLTDIVNSSTSSVAGLSLPRAIIGMFMCDEAPDLDKLRADVEDDLEITSMIPTDLIDDQGRTTHRAPEYHGDASNANEQRLRFEMAEYRKKYRILSTNGVINPIRQRIACEHTISEKLLRLLFSLSTFVPPDREAIFARGTLRFVAGEDMEAASILIPQLESSLRHILRLTGTDTTTTDNDGIQEDASLTILISKHREQLIDILGEEIVHEIEMLFCFKGGPAIRHGIGHAKYNASDYGNENLVWGTWFVIHLALRFLIPEWEKYERELGK